MFSVGFESVARCSRHKSQRSSFYAAQFFSSSYLSFKCWTQKLGFCKEISHETNDRDTWHIAVLFHPQNALQTPNCFANFTFLRCWSHFACMKHPQSLWHKRYGDLQWLGFIFDFDTTQLQEIPEPEQKYLTRFVHKWRKPHPRPVSNRDFLNTASLLFLCVALEASCVQLPDASQSCRSQQKTSWSLTSLLCCESSLSVVSTHSGDSKC